MNKKILTTLYDMTEKRYSQPGPNLKISNDRFRIIREMLPRTGRLLEVGSWDNRAINYYKEKFVGKTYGIDISPKVLESTAPYFDEVKVCDLNRDRIPYDNESFDIIICSEVIEHIYDTDRLLMNIHNVLKSDGQLIISTPNLSSFFNRIFIVLGFQPLYTEVSCRPNTYGNKFRNNALIPAGHIRNFTYGAFRDIVTQCGFIIKEQSAAATSGNSVIHFLERVAGLISVGLGSDIIFSCQKQ